MDDVSFAVILTRGAERANRALESIARQGAARELLLVLNEPDDPMRAVADSWVARGAEVLHDGPDIGVTPSYNLALRAADGEFVCTVHEDSELAPGCVERLRTTLGEHPEAGSVGPRIDIPGRGSADANTIWRDGAASGDADEGGPELRATDYVGTSCLLLRRSAALAVGGFDLRFFPAIYGDVDLAVELWEAGWAVLVDRRALNVHHSGAMVDPDRGPTRSRRARHFLLDRNRRRFVEKHEGWLANQPSRADAVSALQPSTDDLARARAGAAARWEALDGRSPKRDARRRPVEVPDDLAAFAFERRRDFEREMIAHLMEREHELTLEANRVHEAYAELHHENDRLHAAYAQLHREYEHLASGESRA
ncbi:MAG: glycosyltransferase [Solirubrobacterales bacterium]|nr:glycosyltransferase [Solirubrobacterales bacterium]